MSSLTPYPSPEWAPLLPSASPSASHGFRSADSALRGVSDCLSSSVAPFGFSPPCSCGSPLGSVAMDLLPFPVSPSGSRPLSPKGLSQVTDIECPLGPGIPGCAGRTRSLGGEGLLTSGVLRTKMCTRASFAHGGSGWPKDPSISPECERACSCPGHDSMHASTCLPPSGHTGGSSSREDNAFNDGPHTQMPFATGGSSRLRGPCISPVSDCTCRSATPATSVEPTFPRSLPGPCTLDRSAELDLLEDPRYQSVSPFGFCSPSPSGLTRHSVEQNLLPYPVPPLGLILSPLKGCHWTFASCARLTLWLQFAPDVPRTTVRRALCIRVSCETNCALGLLLLMVVQAGRKAQAYPLLAKEPAAALGTIPRLPPFVYPPPVTLEAATASWPTTCHPLPIPMTGRILRCLLLLAVRADRKVQAYPR